MSQRRHRTIILLITVLPAAAWAYACGDGAVEPAPPDPSGPTPTATPATVTVTPATAALSALGATAQLAAQVRDQNGQTMAGATVSWASGDPSVATVSAAGLVTAAGNGTATVTATAGSASGTAAVTVDQAPVSVVVEPADALVVSGETLRLSAEAADANGHAIPDPALAWESSDTLVATVNSAGLVTAVDIGTATMTATAGPASGTAVINVARFRPVRVSVSAAPSNGGLAAGAGEWELESGSTVTTTLSAEPNPGYDFDRWTDGGETLSSDPVHVMKVSRDHMVTAQFSVNQEWGKWAPGGTYTWYEFQAGDSGIDSLSWTFLPAVDPPPSLADKNLLHYYAMNFGVTNSTAAVGRGYAGLQTNGVINGRWQGKAVNFSIWGSDDARTDRGLLNANNEECKCHQIMHVFRWEEGRAYRFVLKTGPSGTDAVGKWWGLWVTDLTTGAMTYIGEQRVPKLIQGLPSAALSARGIHVFGEDLYWWRALPGYQRFVCSDFERSSVAIIDVRAGDHKPIRVVNTTSDGRTHVYDNGHTTTACHVTVIDGGQGDVQHNLGFWPEPPQSVVGGAAGT